MKDLKRVIIAFICTLLFFAGYDFTVGLVCNKLYHEAKYSLFARQNYVLNKSKDDILIIGSSRAARHYIPSIFTDTLGLTCYNAGSNGQTIYYHYGILSSVLERGHKPKLVIYEMMDLDLQQYDGPTFSLDAACDRLSLNYGDYASIDSILFMRGKFEKYKLFCNLYRYNSQIVQLLRCRFQPTIEDNGYERLDGTMSISKTDKEKDYEKRQVVNDELKICYFKKLISLCISNNIPIILVQSPYWNIDGQSEAISKAKQIANRRNIVFIDMANDKDILYEENFYDPLHLNHKGAQSFSSKLASMLKQYIK